MGGIIFGLDRNVKLDLYGRVVCTAVRSAVFSQRPTAIGIHTAPSRLYAGAPLWWSRHVVRLVVCRLYAAVGILRVFGTQTLPCHGRAGQKVRRA
jgi:hypothetical protein